MKILDEIDELLARLEDFTHGSDGTDITRMRAKIAETLSQADVICNCGYTSEMFYRLVNSHFSLFRRLNQINNKEQKSEATQKALEEAKEVNRYFSDKNSHRIVRS